MKRKKILSLGLALIAVAGVGMYAKKSNSAAPVARDGLAAGAVLQAFTLPDPHDRVHTVDASTRLVLFTHDKDVSKMVFEVLGQKPEGYLSEQHAAFILDITAMPKLITRFIAKPRMQRHAFPFLLDAEGASTKAFPAQPRKLTVLHLDGLTVERVGFVTTAEELEHTLAALGGA